MHIPSKASTSEPLLPILLSLQGKGGKDALGFPRQWHIPKEDEVAAVGSFSAQSRFAISSHFLNLDLAVTCSVLAHNQSAEKEGVTW